jgi:acetyl esterase/lipase
LWQKFGLRALNWLADSGGYQVSSHAWGSGDREVLDWYQLDLQTPDAPALTVIFLYGGNWRSGRRQDYRFVADTLCQMGVNVVVPDFPLYPDHKFETILSGAVTAVDYFMDELDPDTQVILMGHSSGAQKAALLTLDRSLLKHPDRINAMIGIAGPYDFYPFTEEDHWDLFSPENDYPRSQPVNFVRADAPELYLLHGADDRRVRRGHSKSLMEKQQAAGGTASREVYESMGHVDAVVSFSRIHRRNSRMIRDIQRFIQAKKTERGG